MANIRYFVGLDEPTLVDVLNDWLTNVDDAIIGELRDPGSTVNLDFGLKFAGPVEAASLTYSIFRSENGADGNIYFRSSDTVPAQVIGSIAANTVGAAAGAIIAGALFAGVV